MTDMEIGETLAGLKDDMVQLKSLGRSGTQLLKNVMNMQLNRAVDQGKEMQEMKKMVENVGMRIDRLEETIGRQKKKYTSAELSEMKKTMSWTELAAVTHMPVSTMQYKVRKHRKGGAGHGEQESGRDPAGH